MPPYFLHRFKSEAAPFSGLKHPVQASQVAKINAGGSIKFSVHDLKIPM
jgi:hypothetical protein